MTKFNQFQNEILNAIALIQDDAVQIAMCKYKDGEDIENFLYDVTYEVIADIMTLIDGYKNDYLKLDIIDRINGKRLKEEPFIELHDAIASFIKFKK